MPSESWLIMMFVVGLLIVGVVGCILTGLAERRRSRTEQTLEQSMLHTLTEQVRSLEQRLAALESMEPAGTRPRARARAGLSPGRAMHRVDPPDEPMLIAVPSLEASPGDRDCGVSSLKERHAAIRALAETGASPEVIARATGQPIGQIELILGLLRQIEGTRSSFPSTPHA